jgi:hypothetical protein
MKQEFKVFYCTFGTGISDPHRNCVQPIIAKDETQARKKMFEVHGNHWCTSYTQESWDDWVVRREVIGCVPEMELPILDARE